MQKEKKNCGSAVYADSDNLKPHGKRDRMKSKMAQCLLFMNMNMMKMQMK